MLRYTFVLAVVAGCYDDPRPACAFLCSEDQTCPADYACAPDGWCKRDDVSPEFVCDPQQPGIDATAIDAPALDAPAPDAPPDDASLLDAATDAPFDAPTD